jgi:hypothetical protein
MVYSCGEHEHRRIGSASGSNNNSANTSLSKHNCYNNLLTTAAYNYNRETAQYQQQYNDDGDHENDIDDDNENQYRYEFHTKRNKYNNNDVCDATSGDFDHESNR